MATYTPYIKKGYVSKEGLTPVYVRYNYDRTKRTMIATGYSIKPEHWDEKRACVKKVSPQAELINDTLTKITSKIGNILTYAKEQDLDPTIEFMLMEIEKEREFEQRSNRVDLFETLEVYIEERTPKVSNDQVKDYRSLRKHLTAFKEYSSQPLTFRNINLKFYNEFMDYLSYKAVKRDGSVGLLTNSSGKIIKLLKGFVNHQIKKGIIPHIDLKNFKVIEEETDAVYLSDKELAVVYNLDLSSDKELEEIRDIFIVGCFTGLRYSDLSEIKSENIDIANGYINIKQRKVHRAVVIPMIDYVPEILEKYNYCLPKISRYKFNERLKELGKMAGFNQPIEIVRKKGVKRIAEVSKKWELISSHTCRRSFCTNMYLSGFPAEELMKISGHNSPAAFLRYIKIGNQQSADRLKALRAKMMA
ncbi:MAG: site-specific integrase [Rikenellaceae bacterium]